MKTYARIASGVVVELLEVDDTLYDITNIFTPELVRVGMTSALPLPVQDNSVATQVGGIWSFAQPLSPAVF